MYPECMQHARRARYSNEGSGSDDIYSAAGIVNTKLIDEDLAKKVWIERANTFLMCKALHAVVIE
jgi:hypothetical protein